LQRRVIEAERSHRESRLWLIAVISSIASVISAATAIVAVVLGK
jgi:type IV secretory pathway component VirB8